MSDAKENLDPDEGASQLYKIWGFPPSQLRHGASNDKAAFSYSPTTPMKLGFGDGSSR